MKLVKIKIGAQTRWINPALVSCIADFRDNALVAPIHFVVDGQWCEWEGTLDELLNLLGAEVDHR